MKKSGEAKYKANKHKALSRNHFLKTCYLPNPSVFREGKLEQLRSF